MVIRFLLFISRAENSHQTLPLHCSDLQVRVCPSDTPTAILFHTCAVLFSYYWLQSRVYDAYMPCSLVFYYACKPDNYFIMMFLSICLHLEPYFPEQALLIVWNITPSRATKPKTQRLTHPKTDRHIVFRRCLTGDFVF